MVSEDPTIPLAMSEDMIEKSMGLDPMRMGSTVRHELSAILADLRSSDAVEHPTKRRAVVRAIEGRLAALLAFDPSKGDRP